MPEVEDKIKVEKISRKVVSSDMFCTRFLGPGDLKIKKGVGREYRDTVLKPGDRLARNF